MEIKNKKGQALLIAVMLLATVFTVVMTIAFNSTSETQVARLEADSQKALAAAEAGIDAVVKLPIGSSVPINSLGQFGSQNISGNAQVSSVSKMTFVTPLLQKDESYTFYLSDYPGFGNPWTGNLDIYLVSEGGCPGMGPSIEVTVITSTNAIERYAFNTCTTTINNATPATDLGGATTQIDDVTFQWKTSTLSIVSGRVAFIKVLGARTKLGFQSATTLPVQGKTVESEARTASGVVKKVQLFQSFPQIPSNFLMTSF